MTPIDKNSQFKTKLLRPAKPGSDASWAFVVLPRRVSEKLPRRGRVTVDVTVNDYGFQATLDPDGQLSHWVRISAAQCKAAGAQVGDIVNVGIEAVEQEPEPDVPADLLKALSANPEARAVWDCTTTIARLDWIHWIESAKQSKTVAKRTRDACDMLASGKARVCCFDQSGYYSKALSAPQAAD